MRRQRKAYEADVKKSEQVLADVSEETGGKLLLPTSSDDMLAQSNEIARAIGAEYVVTYRPKRPLAEAPPGEYRRIQVQSRKVGVTLEARRGYVVGQDPRPGTPRSDDRRLALEFRPDRAAVP